MPGGRGAVGQAAVWWAKIEWMGVTQLNLTENSRWEDLPASAQRALLQAAAKGQLTGLLDPWQPWWCDAAPIARLDGASQDTSQDSAGHGAEIPSSWSDADFLNTLGDQGEASTLGKDGDGKRAGAGSTACENAGMAQMPPIAHGIKCVTQMPHRFSARTPR